MKNNSSNNYNLAIIAIIAALALLGVVVITVAVTIPLQEAEAGCEKGRAGSLAFNQSKGKCLDRGAI
jgi:hypothetical protein